MPIGHILDAVLSVINHPVDHVHTAIDHAHTVAAHAANHHDKVAAATGAVDATHTVATHVPSSNSELFGPLPPDLKHLQFGEIYPSKITSADNPIIAANGDAFLHPSDYYGGTNGYKPE